MNAQSRCERSRASPRPGRQSLSPGFRVDASWFPRADAELFAPQGFTPSHLVVWRCAACSNSDVQHKVCPISSHLTVDQLSQVLLHACATPCPHIVMLVYFRAVLCCMPTFRASSAKRMREQLAAVLRVFMYGSMAKRKQLGAFDTRTCASLSPRELWQRNTTRALVSL